MDTETSYYDKLEARAEAALWESPLDLASDDDDEEIRAEARAEAVEEQIQRDAIDVIANATASRYHTLNWLLWRVLKAGNDDVLEARDDLLKILREETNDYLEAA